MTHALFSFGTLQLGDVQEGLFGRRVPTTPDALAGYVIGELRILDPEVIALSGSNVHPALWPGTADDVVPGALLELSDAELAAADHYERVSYRRIDVTLVSGRSAGVYVPREGPR